MDVLRRAISKVRARLPVNWAIEEEVGPAGPGAHVDAAFRVRGPDGASTLLLVEAKRLLDTRDVSTTLEALARAAPRWGSEEAIVPMLVARYLAPATRERIVQAGAAYADATGNMRLATERPPLFLSDRGSDNDPWRGPGRPRGTLQGAPAARVVRSLVDFAPPYTVPELAKRAGASIGATYRVVNFAEGEQLLEHRRNGPILDVRWRLLLERWSIDYGLSRSNTTATFLEPRGLGALTARLRELPELGYVVTGSLAAERVAAYAPTRLGALYVDDIAAAAKSLGLRQVEKGANVVLAAGDYGVVFDRPQLIDGVRYAAVSQVAVDLLTGPGRNPSEGAALLDWMEANEHQWRQ